MNKALRLAATARAAAGVLLGVALLPVAAAETFTREQAVAHALAHHPSVRAAQAGLDGARAHELAARSATTPSVDLAVEGRVSDDPLLAFSDRLLTRSVTAADFDPARLNDPASSELFTTRLALSWPVYTGGRAEADLRRAGSERAAVESSGVRARERVAYNALAAWHVAAASTEAVRIADQAREAARGHARTTARLVRESRIIESDQLTAEVYLGAVRDAHEKARTRLAVALARLGAALGLPSEARAEPAGWSEPAPDASGTALVELESAALSRRADLKSIEARVQAAGAAIDSAQARYRPQVRVGAASSWYDDTPSIDNQAWSVVGALTMNLYSGGLKDGEVGAARGERDRLAAEQEALVLGVRREVHEAWQAQQGASARLAITRAHLAKARRTVDLVAERYGQGRTLLIDLLQAERALTDTRMAHLEAALDLWLARAALAYATGTLAQ